jgi:hypothetical protein
MGDVRLEETRVGRKILTSRQAGGRFIVAQTVLSLGSCRGGVGSC